MRWKLACSGTVGTTKQPIEKRDFNRLVVEYIDGNTTDLDSWSIKLYNPSTHMMKKYYSGEVYISITPVSRYIGQVGLLHLKHNYYKLSGGSLAHGLNNISDRFDPSDIWRDGLRGAYHTKGLAYRNKASLDRMINPENYDDYFKLSDNSNKVKHHSYLHPENRSYFWF